MHIATMSTATSLPSSVSSRLEHDLAVQVLLMGTTNCRLGPTRSITPETLKLGFGI